MSNEERWWHVFVGRNGGIRASVTLGGSTEHPEELMARTDGQLELSIMDSGPTDLRYVWSFPHEPADAEVDDILDAMAPWSPEEEEALDD